MIQKWTADFQRRTHGSDVDFGKNITGKIRLQIASHCLFHRIISFNCIEIVTKEIHFIFCCIPKTLTC